MKQGAKVHVQPERNEKQQGHKSPNKSQETEIPNLANLTQTGLQHMAPDAMVRLSEMVGNREVARLMAQRQEEDEEQFEGPRTQRQGDDEEQFEGPRTKLLREGAVQQRGGTGLRSSPDQRALVLEGGNIGDAFNVDGKGCYGWDRPMDAGDVANVVNTLLGNQSSETTALNIYIFSGTHGTSKGNLVNTGAAGFVGEDQATATSAMANSPSSQIEVIDVPNTYTTKSSLSPAFTSTAYIRILAWCYSKRSYNNQAGLKSNWWPAPDHI